MSVYFLFFLLLVAEVCVLCAVYYRASRIGPAVCLLFRDQNMPETTGRKKKRWNGSSKEQRSCKHQELIHSCSQIQQMVSECKRKRAIRFSYKTLKGCRKGEERKAWKGVRGLEEQRRKHTEWLENKKIPFAAICSRLRLHLFQCNFNHAIMLAMSTDRPGCAKIGFCSHSYCIQTPEMTESRLTLSSTQSGCRPASWEKK